MITIEIKKRQKSLFYRNFYLYTGGEKKMTHVGINTKLVISLGILLSYAFILNHI